jgi:hypothetical protein
MNTNQNIYTMIHKLSQGMESMGIRFEALPPHWEREPLAINGSYVETCHPKAFINHKRDMP